MQRSGAGSVDDFSHRSGVALVTGGSGGVGAAVCRLLAERGCDVALTYRTGAAAAADVVAAVEAAGRWAGAWPLDLHDGGAAEGVVAEVVAARGGVHTLVHAAGPLVRQVHLSRLTPTAFRTGLEAEAVGFFTVVHHVLPHLREAQGSVVAVTTAGTRRHPARDGLSTGTKSSVEALVRGLAVEEGRFGVRANSVGPGMLRDGMAARLAASGDLDDAALAAARAAIPLRRFGAADDVAEAVGFLASDRAAYVSGQHLAVDGGYTA